MTVTASQFFFILIGVCWSTAQVFKLIDRIEHPKHH